MGGDANDFGLAPLHEPRDKLSISEKALGNDHRDFARAIPQHDAAPGFKEIGRRDEFSGQADQLTRVTLTLQVGRQDIPGLGDGFEAHFADLQQNQLFHAVLLGQFPARLDGVASFKAAAQQPGIAGEQDNGSGIVLQVGQGGVLRAIRSEALPVYGIGNQDSRDSKRFAKAIRNEIPVLISKDFLQRRGPFRRRG